MAALVISSRVLAQADSIRNLADVVVTANKFPQKQSETGKVLTVITHEQLLQSSARSVPEILQEQVGVVVSGANNAPGANQAVYIRGANYANTLILIDGVPLYDASGVSSEFDLNTFAIGLIERIEILKGAQSTLYGSDAVAGVINIITKKNTTKPFVSDITASAGSFGSYRLSTVISGNGGNGIDYSVGYSRVQSCGFSSAYDSSGKKPFDNDGFKQDVLQGSVGFPLGSNIMARVYGKYSYHRADIDAGAFADDKDYIYKYYNAITGLNLQYKIRKTALHFNYAYNWYNRNYTDDSTDIGGYSNYQKGKYTSRSCFTEMYADIRFCKSISWLAGVDYRQNASSQEYIFIPDWGSPAKALGADSVKSGQISGFASLLLKRHSTFFVELGGRWNHHSVYGNNFTYSFDPSVNISSRIKLFANVSSAYRVPSLYQLYSEYGNKDLKPEQTVSYEAGIQYHKGLFKGRAVIFKRDTRDVFVFYTDAFWNSYYKNEDKQKDWGIELESSVRVNKNVSITASYSHTDGEVHTKTAAEKDTTYFNLYRRPADIFNISVSGKIAPSLFASIHLRSASHFFEPQYNAAPYQMPGYIVLNAYAAYTLRKKIKIFTDLRNLTDKEYFDVRGFNTSRFNANAGIQISL